MNSVLLWGNSDILLFALKQKGWSRSELARQAGMNASSVGSIINNRIAAYPTQAERISEALGVKQDRLFRTTKDEIQQKERPRKKVRSL